jgi:hypothetical protein
VPRATIAEAAQPQEFDKAWRENNVLAAPRLSWSVAVVPMEAA